MLRRQSVVVIGSLLAGHSWTPAVSGVPLRIGYSDSLWPLSRGNEDHQADGFLVDAMSLLASRCGLEFQHEAYPWARVQQLVRRSELDGLCTLRTKERLEYAQFCNTVIASLPFGVFHRASDTRLSLVKSVDDLRPLRQGTYRGNGYAKENLEFERFHIENDEESVLRLIAMDRLDAFVGVEFVVASKLEKLKLTDSFRFTPLPFLPKAEYRFGLRRNYQDADAVIGKMEAATVAAKRLGELDALIAKYQQLVRTFKAVK
jgi:ABC-type amino acid transport substrate-binding protein